MHRVNDKFYLYVLAAATAYAILFVRMRLLSLPQVHCARFRQPFERARAFCRGRLDSQRKRGALHSRPPEPRTPLEWRHVGWGPWRSQRHDQVREEFQQQGQVRRGLDLPERKNLAPSQAVQPNLARRVQLYQIPQRAPLPNETPQELPARRPGAKKFEHLNHAKQPLRRLLIF